MKKNGTEKTASELMPSRDDLERLAMSLWSTYGASWVSNVATYETLLQKKREMKIYPLGVIKKTALAEYPQIDFMEIRTEEKAREYLTTMNAEQIFHLIGNIEKALHSHIYVTIRSKILDFRAQIHRREHGVNIYAIDPDTGIPSEGKKPGKRGVANPEGQ